MSKYGCLATTDLTVHMNARRVLANTHPTDYFPQVTKLTFHNLTQNNELPCTTNQLLGLGLKFIPTPVTNITPSALEKTLARFERDIGLKVFFSGSEEDSSYDPSSLRGSSSWRAPLPPRELDNRICRFQQEIERRFIPKRTPSNLTSLQRTLLKQLKNNKEITILSADKGLGPVGVTTIQYITWGLNHLTDSSTYTFLSAEQAHKDCEALYTAIYQWTCRHRTALTDDTVKYIRQHVEPARRDPFGYFYLLAKLHKTPISTRPVCSDCASLPHSIGKWIDKQLQPIVQTQPTYFKNSFELKQLFDEMEPLPPNACLFTYDAISMYTNIDTQQCIQRLTTFLTKQTTIEQYPHLQPTALTEALHLVMNNNRMRFGDLFIHQHKGIAMGMAPAPSIANLFVAIYEDTHIVTLPTTMIKFLRRFIDDGFGIWLRDSDTLQDNKNWETFQSLINNMGLKWEFSIRSNTVTFMDLNIHLKNGRLYTSLHAKPMALHLYIPPTSCHAPGLSRGLIYGHFYRLFMLCSHDKDIEKEIYLFYNRLLDRGYSLSNLIPIFLNAEQKARERRAQATRLQNNPESSQVAVKRSDNNKVDNRVFFHLQYHPSNPPAREIQQVWQRHIARPHDGVPLYQLKNRDGYPLDINKLTIAYSRAPNLGNILSCRKLHVKISDYTDSMIQMQTVASEEHQTPAAIPREAEPEEKQ